ncbi:MAG TPA: C-GCAxxG-C-C family (seleno)protein, partial [Longimicrobiales bacterium]|nr:C-GCAxxG-C-C family (seleno)protein [Longimicrobiales bacterium]
AARRLVEVFRTRHGEIDCLEITHLDRSSSTWKMIDHFLLRGGTVGCLRMAAWYAPLARQEVDSALSREPADAPLPPVSCAATVARAMGASEMRAVMAAGLAGGIGLCGGACGALGAAIWIRSMELGEEDGGKVAFRDSRTERIVDRFLEQTDFQFECSEIVGRRFEDVGDHAAHLRNGGCAGLLEALATP